MQWWLGHDHTHKIIFFVEDSNSFSHQVKGTSSVNDGKWHHVLGVRDAGTNELRIYIDGALENTVSTSFTGDFTSTNPLNIGHLDNSFHYEGLLDEIALYKRTLSATEIQSH